MLVFSKLKSPKQKKMPDVHAVAKVRARARESNAYAVDEGLTTTGLCGCMLQRVKSLHEIGKLPPAPKSNSCSIL